jgi:N-succinyl-L-ornithine transcarbamylase
MKHFTSVKDIANLKNAVETALEIKKDRFAYQHLGKNKTMVLIFLIPVYVHG